MTRSGIVVSRCMHSATTPELGALFGVHRLCCGVFVWPIWSTLLPFCVPAPTWNRCSRVGFAFLLNNWVLIACAFFILVATLFPNVVRGGDAQPNHRRAAVFNRWMAPQFDSAAFLTGIGPLMAKWRRGTRGCCGETVCYPFVVGT